MNLCGTCSHWDVEDKLTFDITQTPEGVHKCTKPKLLFEATEWVDTGDDWEARSRKLLPDAGLMFTQDASDYKADLYTKAEFGCICYEERK